MKDFVIDFNYIEPRWGSVNLSADDQKEAEDIALDHIQLAYPEASEIDITSVKEAVSTI